MTALAIVISKVIAATLLAAIAEVVRRCSARPHLTYGLWSSVLAVLVMPTLVVVPLPEQIATRLETAIQTLPGLASAAPDIASSPASDSRRSLEAVLGVALRMGFVIWLAGCAVVYWRRNRFLRRIEQLVMLGADASASIRDRCSQLATELRAGHGTRVVTAAGRFSPFLWHPIHGRASVVIPAALIARLSNESLDAVLRHELIHLRRKDAWRRRVQFLVTTLWWWLPTASLAGRRLLVLEEFCTDEEVIRANPEYTREYALALLDTEEFLAGVGCPTQFAVPAFTHGSFLRDRIQNIVADQQAPIGPAGRAFAYGSAIAALSLGLLTASFPATSDDGPLGERQDSSAVKQRVATGDFDGPVISGGVSELPDAEKVSVFRSDREIVLAWPRDLESLAGQSFAESQTPDASLTQTVRLVRVSQDGVEPRLWKIDRQDDPSEEFNRMNHAEVDWLFRFLALNNDIVDGDGTRHHHPGRSSNVA